MSKHKPLAGTDLGKAVCKHFGLNPNHVDVVSQIDFRPQAMASIKLTIMLTAEDLAGIARAAGGDSDEAKFALDAKASEILRRYGIGGQAPDDSKMMDAINQLVEETRKMRECLYHIMKNTERSAWLAEDAAATSGTVLRD